MAHAPTSARLFIQTWSYLYELSRGCPQALAVTVGHMEYARLETAALAHVDDKYYYGAHCRKHSARLSLVKLRGSEFMEEST